MKYITAVLFSCVFVTFAHSEITEGGRGMPVGKDHVLSVTAIPGWVLDTQSAVNQGLHIVFYPKGGAWAGSPAI